MRRTGLPSRRPLAREAPAPEAARYLLTLQRLAGNRAVAEVLSPTTPPVQRQIRLTAKTTLNRENLKEKDLEIKFVKWLGKKKIPEETQTRIFDKAKEMIKDDEVHLRNGKVWGSYTNLFDSIRKGLATGVGEAADIADLEPPESTPLSPQRNPFAPEDIQEEIIPKFRRAGSVVREQGPPVGSKSERRHVVVVPYYKKTFERRKRHKEGLLGEESEEMSYATLHKELQGGRSERLTPLGGGPPPSYSALFDTLLLVAPTIGELQLATIIRDILTSGTMPGDDFPVGAWKCLGEIFAVVKLPEMARASFAPGCFAAAANWVVLGKSGLKEAFAGSNACYLGAEKGGAAALQGTIERLTGSKRSAMKRQESRAAEALATLLSGYISKDLEPPAIQARLEDLYARIIGHLALFEKKLADKLVS